MVKIDFQYRPIGFLSWQRQKKILLPTCWNDLTEKQFVLVPDLIHQRLDDSKFISKFFNLNEKKVSRINLESRNTIINSLSWLRAQLPIDHFVIKNILHFNAPDHRLDGITFYAFALSDHYYRKYLCRGEKEDLFKLILCFYYHGEYFGPELLETMQLLLSAVDSKLTDAFLFNYILLLKWLKDMYPNSFRAYRELREINSSINWLSFPWGKKYSLHTAFSYLEYISRYQFENEKQIDEKILDLICTPMN